MNNIVGVFFGVIILCILAGVMLLFFIYAETKTIDPPETKEGRWDRWP